MGQNKHIFILKDQADEAVDDRFEIINLRNPATETNRSWFVDESVHSNGKIYLPTKIDPLFLIIPYLAKQCENRAVPLDHILIDDDFPHTGKITKLLTHENQIVLIADVKKAGNILAYKYNESKILEWLLQKCIRLKQALVHQQIFVARSQNFIKEEKENELPEDEMLQYAHGIISDYLTLELSKKLASVLGFSEEKIYKKRKSTAEIESNQIKKIKKEELHETTPSKTAASGTKKVSAKSKALAKAASQTKSIASFFKK
ncbi:ribonuclease H2 subunit B isoform X2 [Wyeomyia smithii]|uniref:ribonuclease H2 subunit B isoform X2 n=1 Tax=Wyeomyia smithii TaxID=174621 RepID=UPI0024681D56|nr:ribonuclease H2 subunit B isoform X2 [Wyeomyia smithii]